MDGCNEGMKKGRKERTKAVEEKELGRKDRVQDRGMKGKVEEREEMVENEKEGSREKKR